MSLKALALIVLISNHINGIPVDQEEQEVANYLKEVEDSLSTACFVETEGDFNYNGDMREELTEAKNAAAKKASEIRQKVQLELIEKFPNWKHYKNRELRYQVKFLLATGPGNMSTERVQEMTSHQSEISKLRADAKICNFDDKTDCSLTFSPGMTKSLAKSVKENNIDAAEYYWTEAHNAIGKAVTPEMFKKYVDFSNEYAVANDYPNMMASWLSAFDDHSENWTITGFENELQQTLDDFMPYYKKLHAYMRMKLKKARGDNLKLPENGYMPYHIFGSIFGSDWAFLAKETMPFSDTKEVNIDGALKEAGYTPFKIIEVAEQFFTGLNEEWKLPKITKEKSLFERPADENRAVACHPVAYDFCKKNHFLLHMCITVSIGNLKLAYHELGHIFYYLQYQEQPFSFRHGANPGFHEAVGDTIALSVTPKHLKCVLKLNIEAYDSIDCGNGKQADTHPIDHSDINILYLSALTNLPPLPFGLSVDLWRTKVFTGEIDPKDYNKEWWKIREELQGMVPSTPRPPENLDAALLFHVVSNMPYIIYFTSNALKFQFYETLCIAAGQYDPNDSEHKAPLHRCDFSNNKEAGKLLKEMLGQGCSKDWKTILHKFTGSREISLRPLIHYYQPLFDHIDKELKENNFPVCYGKDCK